MCGFDNDIHLFLTGQVDNGFCHKGALYNFDTRCKFLLTEFNLEVS